MQRVFLRDVGGYKAGQISGDWPTGTWTAFERAAADHHGLKAGLDSFSLPVEEAARRYALQQQQPKEAPRGGVASRRP